MGFGHKFFTERNGTTLLYANPDRADKWGGVPEDDWAAADAAENAPVYSHPVPQGPTLREAGYKAGAYWQHDFGSFRVSESDLDVICLPFR